MAFTRYADFVTTSVRKERSPTGHYLGIDTSNKVIDMKKRSKCIENRKDQIRSDKHGCGNESNERNQAACNHPGTIVGSVSGSLREASAAAAAAATA